MTNQIKTILLLGILSALLVALGGAIGPGYLYGALVMSLVLNAGAYFFSDKLVLAMHGAREISASELPALHRMVEGLAARANVPKPRLFLIEDAQPNAFATGRNPAHGVIAVTTGILHLLDERELRGVIAHEMAHIRNRDILLQSVAATVASAVTWIAHAVGVAASFAGPGSSEDEDGRSPAQALVLALVAPLAATLIQLGVSRSREYLADSTGATLCGDPEALARALEKLHHGVALAPAPHASPATASLFIVSPFGGVEGILSLFSTHPRVEERVRRLREMASGRQTPFRAHSPDAGLTF